jgi:valyl-tRNA synthetase
MPHVTEEIHSLFFAERESVESLHVSEWPAGARDWVDAEAEEAGELALAVVEGMRKIKSTAKASVAAPVGTLTVACGAETWKKIEPLAEELRGVSNARSVEHTEEAGPGFVDTDAAGVAVAADLIEGK